MTDRNPTVVVTSDETLSGIVERLLEAANGGHTVDLVVPIDSALLLTAREFRILKDAIDDDRIPLILRTSDPLRLQLAERLGIPARALPRPRVAVEPAPVAPAPSPIVPEPPIAGDGNWPGDTTVAEPVLRPPAESHWPSQNGSADASDDDGQGAEPQAGIDREPAAGNPPRRWLPVAAALAALVVAAVLVIRFVVPQAVVTIVPRSDPVAASVVFDVTTDGQPIDDEAAFALTARPRQIEVVWEGAAPVTGVRVEPDGTASSPIELRNASAEPVVVDAATTVATETGVEFTFTEAVTVPAADPGTGRPGAASGHVRAVQPGSRGNIGTGELGGRLPNGVYYSNRMQPAAGGTNKEFPVVAQEDLDKLSEAAIGAAPKLAAEAIAAEQSEESILASKVTITEQSDQFDHQPGEDAAEIVLRSTLTVDVLTYDASAASDEYERILVARLDEEAPQGFAVAPEEIDFENPSEIQDSDRGVRLEVAAQAEAMAVLDDSERNALVAELAGAGSEQVEAVLGRSPEIADYTVDYQPAWLPEQMPDNAARIRIELAE
jgi:hypothetical protein